MAKKPIVKTLRITWMRSAIGYSEKHKETIKALGLHHLHESVEQVDSSSLRGMLRKVNHLVKVEEQEAK
jgi:large subunit ribosomal protein L30